jgi:hypothetical protein
MQLTCYFGYPGEQAWVQIDGFGESERQTW